MFDCLLLLRSNFEVCPRQAPWRSGRRPLDSNAGARLWGRSSVQTWNPGPQETPPPWGRRGIGSQVRGRRNAVELVLFEISSSMKLYPSVFHAYTSNLRPTIVVFEPTNLDGASNRIPPTSTSERQVPLPAPLRRVPIASNMRQARAPRRAACAAARA